MRGTILRWHRAGFEAFWGWKSGNRAGRPKIDRGLRDLIQRMSRKNPLWGASRIHGELFMFGFQVAQPTVSKYIGAKSEAAAADARRRLRNTIVDCLKFISANWTVPNVNSHVRAHALRPLRRNQLNPTGRTFRRMAQRCHVIFPSLHNAARIVVATLLVTLSSGSVSLARGLRHGAVPALLRRAIFGVLNRRSSSHRLSGDAAPRRFRLRGFCAVVPIRLCGLVSSRYAPGLMVVSPFAPMRRLDVDALFGSSIDPSSSIFVAWKR